MSGASDKNGAKERLWQILTALITSAFTMGVTFLAVSLQSSWDLENWKSQQLMTIQVNEHKEKAHMADSLLYQANRLQDIYRDVMDTLQIVTEKYYATHPQPLSPASLLAGHRIYVTSIRDLLKIENKTKQKLVSLTSQIRSLFGAPVDSRLEEFVLAVTAPRDYDQMFTRLIPKMLEGRSLPLSPEEMNALITTLYAMRYQHDRTIHTMKELNTAGARLHEAMREEIEQERMRLFQ